ncbi:MAG: AsmA-like C-terminal domain-containing protein, partial [Nitrospinota bacterium]
SQFTSLYIDYPKLFKSPLRADEGTIKYALTFRDDSLKVRSFEIASEDTVFKGSFTIKDITSGHGTLTGELSTTPLKAEDIVQLLPSTTTPEVKGLVEAMKPTGQMEVKRLEAKGPFQTLQTDKEIGPIVTASADFVLKNLGLTFGPDIPPFKNWEGEISYNGQEVTFQDVGGRVGEESRVESLNGVIRDVAGDHPIADLTIITHLRAGDFRKHIQRWLTREQSAMLSEETIIEGAVRTDLAVVGPLKRPSDLTVSGLIILDHISITDPASQLSLENILGVLRAQPDHIDIESLTLVSRGRPIRLSGRVHNYMGEVITFTDVAVALGEGLPKLEGLRGSFDKVNYTMVIEAGQPIAYQDGQMEAFQVRLTGLNAAPHFELTFRGTLPAPQVYQLAALVAAAPEENPLLQALNGASGPVEVALTASGPLRSRSEVTWATQLSFDQLTPPPTHPLGGIRSLSGTLNLSPDRLTVTGLTAAFETSEVALHGSIHDYLGPEPQAVLTAETAGLELAEALGVFPIAKNVREARGLLTGHITASGPLFTRLEASRFEGAVTLEKGHLDLDQIPPLADLSARMTLREGEAVVEEARFMFMGAPASLAASIKGFREPVITVRSRFEHLDFDHMAPPLDGQSPWARLLDRALVLSERSLDHPFVRRSVLNLDLSVEQATFQSSTFGPLVSEATLKEQMLTVTRAEIATPVGELKGEGYLDFSGLEPTIFGLKGDLIDGDARRIIGARGPEWDVVTGTFNAHASVKCLEEGVVRGLTGCLQGHLIVRLNDGYIRKTGIVEPLAEKLKFSHSFKRRRVDSVPILRYHTITGDFAIDQGLLTTNNFAIDGSKIKIATDGQVNLFHDTMDLKVSVLTFNAVNQIVHKIPIVNFFAEDDKSLVATYYEVSGGMAEPDVVSIPNRSLEMVLIRTFHKIFRVPQAIIMAPIDLLNQLPPPPEETITPAAAFSDN